LDVTPMVVPGTKMLTPTSVSPVTLLVKVPVIVLTVVFCAFKANGANTKNRK